MDYTTNNMGPKAFVFMMALILVAGVQSRLSPSSPTPDHWYDTQYQEMIQP